ncbi:MAG: WhiB family transcriptional regulator [Pseudonocardia sp.]|nr:WhiB family transcriptional regulator [Pseudonocardia sp.]
MSPSTPTQDLSLSAVTPEAPLPCRTADANLWFAEFPQQLARAQALCYQCPIRSECLEIALRRREPWGVWGGQIFDRGRVITFKRGRGRPPGSRPARNRKIREEVTGERSQRRGTRARLVTSP